MTLPPTPMSMRELRQRETMLAQAVDAAIAAERTAETNLAVLARRRASPREIALARRQVGAAQAGRAGVQGQLADIRGRIRDILAGLADPLADNPIQNLPASTPLLLLPARIETRYFNNATELRVRIFPDQVHIDAHEEPLTADEVAAGRFYWQSWWDASADESGDVAKAAFAQMGAAFRPRRAAWIVVATQPTNIATSPRPATPDFPTPASRPQAWSRAALAKLLPTRWIVTGYVTGTEFDLVMAFQKATSPVPVALQAGPDPLSDKPIPVDADNVATRVPLDDGMLWATDYDVAVKAGMAVTIVDADFNAAARQRNFSLANSRIARLIVHGVRSDLTIDQAATQLEGLLRAHRFSDGIALVRPGTPTNNGDADAGYDSGDAAQIAAMDPMAWPVPAPATVGALAAAFGIDAGRALLDRIEGRGFRDAETAGLLIDALWSATLGQTLDQFFGEQLSDAQIAALRAFAKANLRPGGPLPTLRIGRQPYGVLPVMAREGYVGADKVEAQLDHAIRAVGGVWTGAARRVPTLRRADHTLAENMQELLQQKPLAAHNSFRRAMGPLAFQNSNADKQAAAIQESGRQAVFWALGVKPQVRMASITLDGKTQPLNAPFVQTKIADQSSTLSPNYLSSIILDSTLKGARDRLAKHCAGPSLMEALLANALVYEYDHVIWHVIWTAQTGIDANARPPVNGVMRMAEFVNVETGIAAAPTPAPPRPRGQPQPVTVASSGMAAQLMFPQVTGRMTVADFVTDRLVNPPDLRDTIAIAVLKSTVEDLRALEQRPAAELDRVFRGILDAYSHRLDTWITALATARLGFWRKSAPAGIGIGGFGWVEDLRPDRKPDSDGYIHAPSMQQAQTAAILRSGHLAHRDAAGEALAIDLSSRRVRLALGLLEGIGNGQPLAALLGYRFERMLRETDINLARYILPIRRLYPLNPPPGDTTLTQTEAIAARDVVDGVKLLAKRRAGGWLDGATPAITDAGDRAKIDAVAAAIDDMFDAVKDLLVAEGVHQLVGGNLERASAALAGLDRQSRPVEPEVIHTPRTGRAFAQRAGVLLVEETAAASWTGIARGGRALGEPRVDAWIGRMLGPPDHYLFAATLVFPDDSVRTLDPVSLADLSIDALSVLTMAQIGGHGRQSELQERIAAHFTLQVSEAEHEADAELHLLGGPGKAGALGLAALEAILDRLRAIVGKHRPATANDFAPPGIEAEANLLPDALDARVTAVRAGLEAAKATLGDAIGPGDPDMATLRDALDGLSRAGLPSATPIAGKVDALQAQAEEVTAKLNRAFQAEADAAAAITAGMAPAELAAAHVARLRALLGPGFPVLPPFALPAAQAGPALASLAATATLTDARPALLHGWMARMAEVKPRLAELAGGLAAADMATGTLAALGIVQLPHVAGARWIGLPLTDKTPEDVHLSLVLHAPGLDPAAPPASYAGLISDDWTETIPSPTETTAIAFNYDAPGARPPQTMLLAVHPDPQATAWKPSQILATITATIDLTRIRGVRPQDLDTLGGILPLVYLPENFSTDGPGIDWLKIATLAQAQVPPFLANVLGKG